MSEFLNQYRSVVEIEGDEIDFSLKSFSFSMKESIYQLYPLLTISFEDPGLFQENLFTKKGASWTIKFGFAKELDLLGTTYRVLTETTEELMSPGTVAAKIKLTLIHEWFFDQTCKCRALKNTSSSVVKQIISEYSSINEGKIDSSIGTQTWYQPNITDAKFIKEVLMPNSYSSNAPTTPFYSYINLDGELNFITAKNMQLESKVSQVFLIPDDNSLHKYGNRAVLDIKKISDDEMRDRSLNYIEIYSLSRAKGDITRSIIKANSRGKVSGSHMPVIDNDKDITSVYYHIDSARNTNEQYLQRAKENYLFHDSFFVDKFYMLFPFNSEFKCGERIDLLVKIAPNSSKEDQFSFLSGQYVIESTEHVWDKESMQAYTVLIVGRRFASVPNQYLLKKDLL